jgi:peptidyl-prolyl isomerase E (cyclophilin E)
MEEGTKSKKTVFVGGIGDDIDESVIYEHFATFGDVIEVQLPPATVNLHQQSEAKHRGFAFVTYSSAADAQDAIDNMDLNEMRGRVIKVNLARPMKTPMQLGGNRAGNANIYCVHVPSSAFCSLGVRRMAQTICKAIESKRRCVYIDSVPFASNLGYVSSHRCPRPQTKRR